MLQKLREHSGNWFIKGLFVLLVISFSMWGISDIVFNYINMRPVATIDGHVITQEEFSTRLQQTMSKAQEMSKGQISLDQIKEMGMPQKVLDSLIDQALIAQELKNRHLIVTDEAIRRRVQSIPAFLNEQGTFDKRAFDYLLHTNHLTEAQFIADVRRELQQQQLFGALISGIHLPKTYVDLLFKGFFEQRVFAVVTVPFSKMVIKDTPKENELEEFYQKNQQQFTHPERRTLTLLEINPKLLSDRMTVTSDQLQEDYERRKSEFEVEEKREVKQINFKDQALAEKAAESLKKGRPIQTIAREFKGEFKKLGLITKQQLPEAVADHLFDAEVGQVNGPLSTPQGWQVSVVSNIEPSFTKSFTAVRSQLESEIKIQMANDQIYELKNKIEDALAGGATLAEIAKEHLLKIQIIEAVSEDGKDDENKGIMPEIGKDEILKQAFTLSEKADSSLIETKEGMAYVVHVDAIKPAHIRPFAQIKEEALKAWQQDKRFDLSVIVAQQLAKDARSVSDLARLALSRKLPIKILDPLSRMDSEKDEKIHKQFSPQLISQMFELKADKAAIGVTPERKNGGIQVVMLQKVLTFSNASLKEKQDQMQEKLAELASQDATNLYVKSLRAKAKVNVNQAIYDVTVNRG